MEFKKLKYMFNKRPVLASLVLQFYLFCFMMRPLLWGLSLSYGNFKFKLTSSIQY